MNRRFAVLGLVAMCGTVVAGQTAQKEAPVTPELLRQDGTVTPELLQQNAPAATFRVESVGSRTRVHVTADGGERWTFEALGFTVTTQASGTTITASGPVTLTTADGKTISFQGLTLELGPNGKVSGVSRSGLRR